MFNKLIVCDCFLEIACHCLGFSANFGQFKKMCLMHFDNKNGSNSAFVIMNACEQFTHQSPFYVTYMGCCKDFVDFQIDLFNETSSFCLRSIDCENTNEQQQDVNFDYEGDMYLIDYNDVDSDVFDSSSDDDVYVKLVKGHAFSSSLCFTQMRPLCRFSSCCQEVFLMYFVGKLLNI